MLKTARKVALLRNFDDSCANIYKMKKRRYNIQDTESLKQSKSSHQIVRRNTLMRGKMCNSIASNAVTVKIARRVLLLVSLLLASSLLGCSFYTSYKSDRTEDYDKFVSMSPDSDSLMPNIEDLGNYMSAVFGFKRYVQSAVLRFDSECVSLFASYDRYNYDTEREKALASYEFLKEPVLFRGNYIYPVASFEYNGYSFRIVPKDHYEPKSFLMVGVNDAKMKIAYLFYHDTDLDYLSEGNAGEANRIKRMQELVRKAFVWE